MVIVGGDSLALNFFLPKPRVKMESLLPFTHSQENQGQMGCRVLELYLGIKQLWAEDKGSGTEGAAGFRTLALEL